MERIAFLWALFLFCLCEKQVFSSGTPVFVQKGGDVTLEVTESDVPEGFELLLWKFGTNDFLVSFPPKGEPNVRPNYSGRIEFVKKLYSVKLKNLQKTDSGVYTSRVIGAHEKILAEYNVTVQDPVSPVQLTVNSVSSSSDSCNLTVTCSTEEDSQISRIFRCFNQTCYQEGGERSEITKFGASLHVYLSDESIVCNHSNDVSQKQNTTKIQNYCTRYYASQEDRYHLIPIVVISIIVVSIIGGGVYYKQRKGKYDREDAENTVYAVPQVPPAQGQGENSTDDASSPTTTYSMIGLHTQMGSTENGGKAAESVYAQVQKPILT